MYNREKSWWVNKNDNDGNNFGVLESLSVVLIVSVSLSVSASLSVSLKTVCE